jgi:hypothetical protein
MTAQDINQLGDEEIIGFHRRLPPFKARRMDWRRFPTLVQRRHLPAPQLETLPELERLPMPAWQGSHQPAYLDPDMVQ